MSAGTYNSVIEQGASWSVGVTINTGATDPPTPIDIDGYTFLSQVRTMPVDAGGTLLATITVTIVDHAAGQILLSLTGDQTAEIPTTGKTPTKTNTYYWDLFVISGDLVPVTTKLLEGSVTVYPMVSKDSGS